MSLASRQAAGLLALVLGFCLFLVQPVSAGSPANSLLKSAQHLKTGQYYIQNVATGQRLTGNRHHLFPAYGRGTPVTVVAHNDGSRGKQTVLGLGGVGQRQCLSASWPDTKKGEVTGGLYTCVLGLLATGNARTDLEPEKQAFLLVPSGAKYKRGVPKATGDIPAARNIFAEQDGWQAGTSSFGPFYIVAKRRIHDEAPKAVANMPVIAQGRRAVKLAPWSKGAKTQLWEFIPVDR